MGYSLKINYKKIESNPKKSTPESRKKRDQQFTYIGQIRESFLEQSNLMISVDSKKKESVGNFKNQGAIWCTNPKEVIQKRRNQLVISKIKEQYGARILKR